MKTKKEILEMIKDEMTERLVRSEIDLAFWTSIGVNPTKNLDAESTKNISRQIQQQKRSQETTEKLLEIVEKMIGGDR